MILNEKINIEEVIILYHVVTKCDDISKENMRIIKSIQNRIYEIRGERVMPDSELLWQLHTELPSQNQA